MKSPREKIRILCALSNRFATDESVAEALAAARSGGMRLDLGALIRMNRVAPQVVKNLRRRGMEKDAPAEIFDSAVSTARAATAHNMLVADAGQKIIAASAASGIGLIPLKGLSLIGRLYGFDERGMSDMDFFIRGADLPEMKRLLASLRYQYEPSGLPKDFETGYSGEIKFRTEIAGMRIDAEFHWDPSPGPALGRAFPLKAETVWDMARVEGGGWSLSPEGEILYYIHHLCARHSFSRLMWFLDIHYLIETYAGALNVELLKKSLKDAGLSTASKCVFRFIEKYFGASAEGLIPAAGGADAAERAVMDLLVVNSLSGARIKKSGILPGLAADTKFSYFYYYLFPDMKFLKMRYPEVPAPMLRLHRLASFLPWLSSGEEIRR